MAKSKKTAEPKELTQAQKDKAQFYVDKWVKVVLSTDRIDKVSATAAVNDVYKSIDMPAPAIIWLPCPVTGLIAATVLPSMVGKYANEPRLRSVLTKLIAGSVVKSDDKITEKGLAAVRAGMLDVLLKELAFSYDPELLVEKKLTETPPAADIELKCREAGDSFYGGSVWAPYAAWADFSNQECGTEISTPYLDFTLNCGYTWFLDGYCIITDRPDRLEQNSENRLSSTDGMAIRYTSGWGHWFVDQIPVDEQIVLRPETQTLKQIEEESNGDVRSIRISRYGWPRYLKGIKAKVLDSRINAVSNTPETLYALPDGGRRLLVGCVTERPFSMGIAEGIDTCEAAQTWMQPDPTIRVIGAT